MTDATTPDSDLMDKPDTPGEQRRLDEFTRSSHCQAIAEYSGDRCQRRALPGTDYCALHLPDHTGDTPRQAPTLSDQTGTTDAETEG